LQFTFMQESALMGSGGFHDLIENETAWKQFSVNAKDATNYFDVFLACKRFPAIVLDSVFFQWNCMMSLTWMAF
jgi:hypothetical protein